MDYSDQDQQSITAPALFRGLELLRLLQEDGPQSIEVLSRKSGYPKTSVRRLVKTLEAAKVARRDPRTKLLHALVAFTPLAQEQRGLRELFLEYAPLIAESCKATLELWSVDDEMLVMVDRCEPMDVESFIRLRIGKARELYELDALRLISCACGTQDWPQEFWRWDAGAKVKLKREEGEPGIESCRVSGWAMDNAANDNGVIRVAAPVIQEDRLTFILSIATTGSARQGDASEWTNKCKEEVMRMARRLSDA